MPRPIRRNVPFEPTEQRGVFEIDNKSYRVRVGGFVQDVAPRAMRVLEALPTDTWLTAEETREKLKQRGIRMTKSEIGLHISRLRQIAVNGGEDDAISHNSYRLRQSGRHETG